MSPLLTTLMQLLASLLSLALNAASNANATSDQILAQYDAIDQQFRTAIAGLAATLARDDQTIDREIAAAPAAAPGTLISAAPIVTPGT